MSPRVSTEAKLALLNVIKQNKDILFGRFSSDIDNMHKQEKWEEVLVKSKSLGICAENRDRNFVRDKVYGTWKSRTLDRLDRAKKTAHGLDPMDIIMLEIIGKEKPPTVEGFQAEEESAFLGPAPPANDDDDGEAEDDDFEGDMDNEPDYYDDDDAAPPAPTRLLEKKRKLELEFQELQNYKKKLEILKLEMELGVPQSVFTQEFGVIVKTLRTSPKSAVRSGVQKGKRGN